MPWVEILVSTLFAVVVWILLAVVFDRESLTLEYVSFMIVVSLVVQIIFAALHIFGYS